MDLYDKGTEQSRPTGRLRAVLVSLLLVTLAAGLEGCATVASSGPTAGQIEAAERKDNELGFRIVDINAEVVAELDAQTANEVPLAALEADGRVDTLGPGDVLEINIYEVGVTLFTSSNTGGTTFDPSARGTALANVVVSREGDISLPYIGRLQVAGSTNSEVARMIERAMARMSQQPQAVVTVKENFYNTFYVSGDIRNPGRYALTLPRERLLDALARAGGTTNQPNDMIVRLTRNGRSSETRLSEIDAAGPQNVLLLPGDRIELFNQPRTFLAFGSISKVSQVAFGASSLSLAEAIARIGGPNEATANPAAVYLFRYGAPVEDDISLPVIYRLNMNQASSYFLSQDFEMRDKDVIYIAAAPANGALKITQILSQLFTPFITARALTQSR